MGFLRPITAIQGIWRAKGILILFSFKLLVPRLTVPELDIFET